MMKNSCYGCIISTQKVVQPPVGTSPKEKLHDVIHAKINGPKATSDAAFKTGLY